VRLDETADRYAKGLFGQRIEQASKQGERQLKETLADLARRGLFRSGAALRAKFNHRTDGIRAAVDAKVQSYLDAYQMSGTPFEGTDVEWLTQEVSQIVNSRKALIAREPELMRLHSQLEADCQAIVAQTRRRLEIHLDGQTLENRRKQTYASPSLHNLFESEFSRLRQALDSIGSGLADQVMEASDRLEERTPEAVSHCALTCRRTLKAFADAVYPARDDEPSGKNLDDAHFVNRLWQYTQDRMEKKSSRELVQLSLDSLGRRVNSLNDLASKGVHSTFAQHEAERCLIQTVFLLSELSEL